MKKYEEVYKKDFEQIQLEREEWQKIATAKSVYFSQREDAVLQDLIDDQRITAMEENTDPGDYEIGAWECESSPIGVCLYNRDDDPCFDYCLFCEEPDERK